MFSTTYDTLEYSLLRARIFIIETLFCTTKGHSWRDKWTPRGRFSIIPKASLQVMTVMLITVGYYQNRWYIFCLQILIRGPIIIFGRISGNFLQCNTRRKGDWCLFVSPVCNYWYLSVLSIDFQFLELSSFIIKLNRLDWPVRWVIIFRFSPL